MKKMKVFVTDFDGVICDGLKEYFYSSKLTFQSIWHDPDQHINLDRYQEDFNFLRPVVETGWEMPLLLRVLTWGETRENILENWHYIKENAIKVLHLSGIKIDTLANTLDTIREQQIKEDVNKWLSLQTFYQGVIPKLKYLIAKNIKLYIITTKEGKFARKLLEQENIFLPDNAILGKEVKRPKYESLRLIIDQEKVNPSDVCFLEDRLEALELVSRQSDLQEVKLLFALWGYNTEKSKLQAEKNSQIITLSLQDFTVVLD